MYVTIENVENVQLHYLRSATKIYVYIVVVHNDAKHSNLAAWLSEQRPSKEMKDQNFSIEFFCFVFLIPEVGGWLVSNLI